MQILLGWRGRLPDFHDVGDGLVPAWAGSVGLVHRWVAVMAWAAFQIVRDASVAACWNCPVGQVGLGPGVMALGPWPVPS